MARSPEFEGQGAGGRSPAIGAGLARAGPHPRGPHGVPPRPGAGPRRGIGRGDPGREAVGALEGQHLQAEHRREGPPVGEAYCGEGPHPRASGGEELGGTSVEDEAPRVEDQDPPGPGRLGHVLGDVDDGHPRGHQRVHEAEDRAPRCGVEHGRRLVEGHAARGSRQDSRHGEALLLAGGEEVGGPALRGLEAHGGEGRVDAAADLLPRKAQALGSEGHVLLDGGRHDLVGRELEDQAHLP